MRMLLLLSIFASATTLFAQQQNLSVTVVETKNLQPVAGATIHFIPSNESVLTDENGKFSLRNDFDTAIKITSIGYQTTMVFTNEMKSAVDTIFLSPAEIMLNTITISSGIGEQYQLTSKLDIKKRGINNSQEVLRMIPGLFIGQHAGGGKAEQIFLRGFDLDHGTDINIAVDGIPVNMVSHAHGQGYADLHFLIPELIDNVSFKKGPYYADKGNFATTGFVDFKTINAPQKNFVKMEGGMFHSFRTVGLMNMLGEKQKSKGQSAYIASEYMYTKGYFNHPQNFNRLNVFGKYYGQLSRHNTLNLSASTFYSKWDASGQIPERAVESGMIGFYGAIDPDEGGETSRTNINVALTTNYKNGSSFFNQVYFSDYHFGLYSNFTFYKVDSVNGDQVRQKEKRTMYGYNGSYRQSFYAGRIKINSEMGASTRFDRTRDSELSRTKNRCLTISPVMMGNILENNFGGWISETISFSTKFDLNAGLRYDVFYNEYHDQLNGDASGHTSQAIWSPKLSFNYRPNERMQFYFSNGKGFHSNDTRVVVPQQGLHVLPAAYGSDLGTMLKPNRNILINAALWYLWLNQEFIYVGDEGIVEPGGKTKRYGVDLSVRCQPKKWLYADADFNFSHGRATDEIKGQNYLPLAPVLTSTGGITVKAKHGIKTSLRYRYMGDRPANEDYSVIAKGYFITDAFVNYQKGNYEMAFTVQNLFNAKWKETQFDAESRLKFEPQPVSEIHFTAGTPITARMSFTLHF